MNRDILTAIEVDDKIESLSNGACNLSHATAVKVTHNHTRDAREGIPTSFVSVYYAGEWHAIKAFSHNDMVAAECYGHDVADVLGVSLEIKDYQRTA